MKMARFLLILALGLLIPGRPVLADDHLMPIPWGKVKQEEFQGKPAGQMEEVQGQKEEHVQKLDDIQAERFAKAVIGPIVGALVGAIANAVLRDPNQLTTLIEGVEIAKVDFDGNGFVEEKDWKFVAEHLGKKLEDLNLADGDSNPDVNHDGIIDIFDLTLVARHMGKENPFGK